MGQAVAAPQGGSPHARIGQLSGMSAVSACRVGLYPFGEPPSACQFHKYSLCGRGSADIAQADEEQSCFHRCFFRFFGQGREAFVFSGGTKGFCPPRCPAPGFFAFLRGPFRVKNRRCRRAARFLSGRAELFYCPLTPNRTKDRISAILAAGLKTPL